MNENWSHDRCLLSRAFAGLKIHGKATLFFSLDQEQYDGPVVVVGQGGARCDHSAETSSWCGSVASGELSEDEKRPEVPGTAPRGESYAEMAVAGTGLSAAQAEVVRVGKAQVVGLGEVQKEGLGAVLRRPGVPGEVLSGEDGPGRVQGEGLGVIQEWPGVPREAPSGGMVERQLLFKELDELACKVGVSLDSQNARVQQFTLAEVRQLVSSLQSMASNAGVSNVTQGVPG